MKLQRILMAGIAALALSACGGDDDDPFVPQPVVEPGQTDKPTDPTQPTVDSKNKNKNSTATSEYAWRLEFPKLKGGNSVVLVHTAPMPTATNVNYTVEWDTNIHAQRWTCYQMYSSILDAHTSRYTSETNQYPQDPMLLSNYRVSDNIYGSGYDHGHICPSADRLCSYDANYQTFFMTNMQPQSKALNGSLLGSNAKNNDWSPWYKLEGQIRTWTNQTNTTTGKFADTLYVVKGGTIDSEANIIKYLGSGSNRIPVPKYFFVAILCKNSSGYKAIGFWMEHVNSYTADLPLKQCAVNIRELEQKTGIDFFCNLPDDVEETVETLAVDAVKRAWGLN